MKAIFAAGRSWLAMSFLLVLAIPFLLPFLWMLSTAFKPAAFIYAQPPQWIPSPLTMQNFQESWGLLDFPRFFLNTLFVAGFSVIGSTFSSSLVGFAFAILPGRGKNLWFNLLLATIMLPASILIIPQFILFSRLGWTNTYLPLIVPQFCANAFYVFLFRQFFRSLPFELFESAELDGCNPLQTYWQIALPLSRPVLAAVAVFAFIAAWNDFIGPLIYLSDNRLFTISLGLSLFQGLHYTQIQYLMAMSLVALLPVVILFFWAQRYFVENMAITGLKT
jgi:multiple sugar transport system permease protein